MAIVVAADMFGAHLRFQDGDVEGVRGPSAGPRSTGLRLTATATSPT